MPDIHRIGIISDTHIPRKAPRVPDAALNAFTDVELILHAGDLSTLAVLRQLSAYAPVEAVQGNIEEPEVRSALPITRELVVGGCRIGLVHILGERKTRAAAARREFPEAQVVVFGHSHIPELVQQEDLLLLNPGSATDRRTQPKCSIALLEIVDGTPRAQIIWLE